MTRNQSPSEPMSAPVFYTKRIVDCTFQSKKQIANLVCDICLVFRNFMIAFNLDLDFLKHLLFLLYNCAKLFCYQVEYFYMWILDGGGVKWVYMYTWMFEFIFACNAMQYENYRMSKLNICLFTWCYCYLCLYVINNLPEIFVIIAIRSSNGSTLIYDDVCAYSKTCL